MIGNDHATKLSEEPGTDVNKNCGTTKMASPVSSRKQPPIATTTTKPLTGATQQQPQQTAGVVGGSNLILNNHKSPPTCPQNHQKQAQNGTKLGTNGANSVGVSGRAKEVFHNTKNAMINSFTSVIESTKDLTLSDEKQRSPTKNFPLFTRRSTNSSLSSSEEPAIQADPLTTAVPQQGSCSRAGKAAAGAKPVDSAELAARLGNLSSAAVPIAQQQRRQLPSGQLVTLSADHIPVPAKCSSQLRKLIHSHSLSQPPLSAGTSPVSSLDLDRPGLPNLSYSPYGSPSSSPRIKRKPVRETTRVNSITEKTGEYVQLNQYKLDGAIGQVRKEKST